MKVLLCLCTLLAGLTSLHSQPFSWQKVSGLDSLWCITSNGYTMYAGKDNEIYSSTDDGFSWQKFFVWPIQVDTQGTMLYYYSEKACCMKAAGDLLYVGSVPGDYGGLTGGVHLFGPGVIDSSIGKQAFAVFCIDEQNSHLVVNCGTDDEPFVAYSPDKGVTWDHLCEEWYGIVGFYANGILRNEHLGSAYDSLEFSADTGRSWTLRSSGFATYNLCSNTQYLFSSISMDSMQLGIEGAAYSLDTGRTWQSMDFTASRSLCTHNGYLYSTTSDGIYRTSISHIVEIANAPNQTPLMYPNPTQSRTTLSLPATVTARSLRICSSEGRLLYELSIDGNFSNTLDVDLGAFALGVYLLQVVMTNGDVTCQVIVKE